MPKKVKFSESENICSVLPSNFQNISKRITLFVTSSSQAFVHGDIAAKLTLYKTTKFWTE